MNSYQIIHADARTGLAQIADATVDCLVTSPPYWALRKYDGPMLVFGGDADCEHVWSGDIVGAGSRSSDTKPGAKQTPGATTDRDKLPPSQFCSSCGAWRGQLGLEPHPQLYLEHLWEIFDECKRVLKPTGTAWINMGDTYCSTGGTAPAHRGTTGGIGKPFNCRNLTMPIEGQWLKPKNLLMIPERFAIGMQERGWWLRNKIIWHKPNAMPSSVKDRFSCTYEYLYFFTKSARYWFDLDAVREPLAEASIGRAERYAAAHDKYGSPERPDSKHLSNGVDQSKGFAGMASGRSPNAYNPAGKNPGDCWTLPTFAWPEAHFATYPPELIRKPIRAGCPPKVCVECGKPWVRIVEERKEPRGDCFGRAELGEYDHGQAGSPYQQVVERKTIGWQPTCECGEAGEFVPIDYSISRTESVSIDRRISQFEPAPTEPGTVLDPFLGSGTTLVVAIEEERQGIGIEISEKYCEMATKRCKEAQRKHQPRLQLKGAAT